VACVIEDVVFREIGMHKLVLVKELANVVMLSMSSEYREA
jgi:hypothetical protein